MSIEAMKQALEALESCTPEDTSTSHVIWPSYDEDAVEKAITSLHQAIAEAEKQEPEAAPVAKNEGGKITWMIDDWPQNCLLYTHPPKSFTYEQVKAHIRAASMSANDISLGSDVTDDGVSIVIRRRDEILYAEFFAHPQPKREPLTFGQLCEIETKTTMPDGEISLVRFARAIEAAHGIGKGEA
jgi:hypothetical protein